MTKEQYNERLAVIQKVYEQSKMILCREYAMSNTVFKIGDIIKDDRWTFEIDCITFYKSFDYPEPVYKGFELKKDLTPKKNGNRGAIFGNKATLIKSAE